MAEGQGLSEEQRSLVQAAAAEALVELMTEHPEVAKIPAATLAQVFLAGVAAGVDALDAVLKQGLPEVFGAPEQS